MTQLTLFAPAPAPALEPVRPVAPPSARVCPCGREGWTYPGCRACGRIPYRTDHQVLGCDPCSAFGAGGCRHHHGEG